MANESRGITAGSTRAVAGVLLALVASGCPITPKFVIPKSPLNGEWSAANDPRLATKVAADTAWWTASTIRRSIA